MGRRKKESEGSKLDTTLWMVTFSDLLQLLLTFFVLLISMSSMDNKGLKEMFSSFTGALGPLGLSRLGGVTTPDLIPHLKPKTMHDIDFRRLVESSATLIKGRGKMGLEEGVGVSKEKEGVLVTFPDSLLFVPGDAKINPDSYNLLDDLTHIIRITRSDIEVYGHTDNNPINTARFSSNWDLSIARAVSIVEYLVSKGVDPKRLAAVGAGEYSPLYPNNSTKYRRRNRRVEILIKQEKQ